MRPAVPGSDFCWIHYPRGYNWIPTIIGVLLGCLLGFMVNELYFQRTKDLALMVTNIQRSREVPRLNKFPFRISEGNNIITMRGPGTFQMTSFTPFSFRATEEKSLLFNGEIRDQTGVIVADVKDSQLFVLSGVAYDVNSDHAAFEVVDENLRPILQFYRKNESDTLQVNYVAYMGRSARAPVEIMVCNEQGCSGGRRDVGESARQAIRRIFKYPGHKYSGVRLQD